MSSSARALRRLVGFGAVTVLSASIALSCSESSPHPPISGDCFGEQCAPPLARHVAPNRSGDGASPDGAAGNGTDDGGGNGGGGGAVIDTNVTLSPDAFPGGALIDTNVTLSPDAFF
jgi:hypothetical protein